MDAWFVYLPSRCTNLITVRPRSEIKDIYPNWERLPSLHIRFIWSIDTVKNGCSTASSSNKHNVGGRDFVFTVFLEWFLYRLVRTIRIKHRRHRIQTRYRRRGLRENPILMNNLPHSPWTISFFHTNKSTFSLSLEMDALSSYAQSDQGTFVLFDLSTMHQLVSSRLNLDDHFSSSLIIGYAWPASIQSACFTGFFIRSINERENEWRGSKSFFTL